MRLDNLGKSNGSTILISLVARHQLVRESLKSLFESNSDLKIGKMSDFDQVLSADRRTSNGDVSVIFLEPGDPVESVAALRTGENAPRVVVVTVGNDLDTQTKALKAGAVGIVRADQSSKLLIEAVRQAAKGETWLNQALLSRLIDEKPQNGNKAPIGSRSFSPEKLTPREVEVTAMIGKGLKSKLIAKELNISEATVRHHLSSIYGKLGVDDRLNLVIFAFQNGLVEVPSASPNGNGNGNGVRKIQKRPAA